MAFFRRARKTAAVSVAPTAATPSHSGPASSAAELRRQDAASESEARDERALQALEGGGRAVQESLASSSDVGEDSDVFVCRRDFEGPEPRVDTTVTLIVTGWHSVEPGPLSWAFPSVRAALDAVRKMRNAIAWSIVAGSEWTSVEDARANGAVLIEQH